MGVLLSSPITSKESVQEENDRLGFGASSMQGWRTGMEDAHIGILNLSDHISLFGVFDGHGGREVSRFISQHLPELLVKNENFKKGIFEQALKECYLELDVLLATKQGKLELHLLAEKKQSNNFQSALENFLNRAALGQNGVIPSIETQPEKKTQEPEETDPQNVDVDSLTYGYTSGSTGVSVLMDLKKGQILVANVGDSRSVLCRAGKAIELSVDHKPHNQGEYQRITKAGGFVQNGRVNGDLNLSRAIGDMQYKTNTSLPPEEQMITAFPEVKIVDLTPADEFVVIACDGVWDVKSSQQVVDFVGERIKNKIGLSTICEQLLDACLAPDASGVGTDNMTVIIITLKPQAS